MRNYIIYCAFLATMTLMIRSSNGEVVDKIAIVVNDEVITEGEINRMVAPVYERYKTMYRGEALIKKLEEAKQKVVAQIIEDKLILSAAKKVNIEVNEKDVMDRIDSTIKRFGSRQSFEKELSGQRITLRDLKRRYKEQLMVQRIIDDKIAAKITVTPADANNYYNAHLDEFILPAEIKLRNILIKPKSELPAHKAFELAREISRRLKEGGDFGGLAKVYSDGPNAQDGGLMEYAKKGDLLPEIEKAVSGLQVGQSSDIIQTSLGYHIFKVEDRKESRTQSFLEVRREVEEKVFKERVEKKIGEWIGDLKKNAYIAFK